MTLADEAGKHLGKHVRKHLKPVVEQDALPSQMGSVLNLGACDSARLIVRSWPHIAQVRKTSLAVLFVDARSAYASVIRSWVAPHDDSAAVWVGRLEKAGFSEVEAGEMLLEAEQYLCWRANGDLGHLHAVTREAQTTTP